MLRLILSKDFSISFSLIVYILRRFNSVEGGGGGGHWWEAEGEIEGGRYEFWEDGKREEYENITQQATILTFLNRKRATRRIEFKVCKAGQLYPPVTTPSPIVLWMLMTKIAKCAFIKVQTDKGWATDSAKIFDSAKFEKHSCSLPRIIISLSNHSEEGIPSHFRAFLHRRPLRIFRGVFYNGV